MEKARSERGYEQVEKEETYYNATRDQMLAWQQIAARDGAMTIFHFGMTAELIDCSVPTSLQTSSAIQKRRTATKLFSSFFPRFVEVRNAVAHAGEISGASDQVAKHARKGAINTAHIRVENPNTLLFMSGNLAGRSFESTFGNEVVSYEVSESTLGRLKRVTEQYYAAFEEFQHPAVFRT